MFVVLTNADAAMHVIAAALHRGLMTMTMTMTFITGGVDRFL